MNCLRDGLGAVRLARVDRTIDVVVAHQLKRGPVMLGRKIGLGARQVEANHAAALVRNGQLGHLIRRFRGNVTDPAQDDVGFDAVGLARTAQAVEHRFHDLGQLQAALRVQHRRVAHFHIAHVLAVRVFGELEGNALERGFGLHDA